MKSLLRVQETRTGKRNLIGRRMVNTLLKAGGFIDQRTGEFSTELKQVQNMRRVGQDMSSAHGLLYTGVLNEVPVIVKIPKSYRARVGWKSEISMTARMSEANISPEIYVQSIHPHPFLIMKRYDSDVFNYMNGVLDMNKPKKWQKAQGDKLKKGIRRLIDRISEYHGANPDAPLCFGDFRMENLVVDKGTGDVRQIDFDEKFCAANNAEYGDLKLLYMLVISFSYTNASAEDLKDMFPPSGRIFEPELRKKQNEIRSLVQRLKPVEDAQVRKFQSREPTKLYMLNLRRMLTEHRMHWTEAVLQHFPTRKSPISITVDME
tara:strand:- start:44 stop:1003 length:960 start_codon:yes stop_codon:yes gene_type:complete